MPVIIRGRRRSGRNAGAGYKRRDWLPVNELGGATRHPARSRWRSGSGKVRPCWETLPPPSCSSWTRPTSSNLGGTGWSVSFQLQGGRAAERLCGQAALRAPAAELLSVEEVCADFDAMLRHNWKHLGTPQCAC